MSTTSKAAETSHEEEGVALSDRGVELKHQDLMRLDTERAPEARGRDLEGVPRSYWYSPAFLGSYCAIGFSFLAASGGFGLISPLLANINEDLGPSDNIAWISLTWLLTQAVTYLIVGRLTDMFGRRWFFIIGSCIGLIGSIVGACAQTVEHLIGAMVFLGIGAGIMLCFFWASAEIVPMKYRYLATAGTYIFSTPTNPMAPKLAYAIQTQTSVRWRGCFYFEIAAHVVAIACWYFFYHPPTFRMLHRRSQAKDMLKNFDWIGLALYTGSALVFLLGLSWGGGLYPWNSAYVIGAMVAGAVGIAIFAVWENSIPWKDVDPFFPLHLFRNPRYMAVSWLTGFASANYYAFAIIWPGAVDNIYTSVQGDYKGTLYGLVAMSFVFGQIVGGCIATWTGPRLATIALMMMAFPLLGAAATNPMNMHLTMAFVITGMFTVAGADAIAISSTTFPLRTQEEIGTAGGLSGFIRVFTSTVAVAIYSTVLNNRLAVTIPGQVIPAVIAAGLPSTSTTPLLEGLGGTSVLDDRHIPGLTNIILEIARESYRVGYSQAVRTVFLTNLSFCGVALILSFFVVNNDRGQGDFIAGHIHNKSEREALEKQEG